MKSELSLAYLTGSAKVTKNNYFNDIYIPRERRTIPQMFFTPYESEQEFIYCARYTGLPLIAAVSIAFHPVVAVSTPILIGIILGTMYAAAGVYNLAGKKDHSADITKMATNIAIDALDSLIALLVLPASLTMMATRGISSGLKATGIYDYDAHQTTSSTNDVPAWMKP